MKKFKYPFLNRIRRKLHKKRIKLLEKEARDRYKANRLFTGIFGVLYWTIMIIFLSTMIIVEQKVEPIIGKTLFIILLIFMSFFLPAIILSIPYMKLHKKYPQQSLGDISRDVIKQCNFPLFKFYIIPEIYLVTKCYNSSNQLLVGKDLILFFYKDKLRIVNDFTTTIKDFGCYELQMNDIEILYDCKDNLVITVIKSNKLNLSLGKRAKPFIRRYSKAYN